ncbi:nicotinate-nucleotide--dimethylbenzimidazole phosphoribosyltransferase [Streptomyces sp. NEAU-sy36]|uniref:nicotinate-nucleotide--dimethylbenzimidazole phosphoribosyltransferase n=1 Tax=unclassified Streptomyces TaxID=2593676 RepID=UPI0015D5F351|nr:MULTISPECIES: nicotinate-nucleotide--dimethylbenzimidazole phosphoribosyltransferase [unclassified Streptomyces]QLJ01367.1 nicotinate-nucleotide--dimethylbenzimidazole phosphoribosyltransferase [Streptomyces sp. NEAU-sy36]
MTDTGQVPGEGQPESAGMVEQPGVTAHGAYTYLSEAPAEDEDLLLPGAQGAWGNEVPPPAPEPVVEALHEPDPHEAAGRDTGSVDLSGVRLPSAQDASGPRRPLHLGPPIPNNSAGPVRSLADRGPEYLDAQPLREMGPQSAAPWGAGTGQMPGAQTPGQAPAAAAPGPVAAAAEAVGAAPGEDAPVAAPGTAEAAPVAEAPGAPAAGAETVDPAAVPAQVEPAAQVVQGHDGPQPADGHDGVYATPAPQAGEAPLPEATAQDPSVPPEAAHEPEAQAVAAPVGGIPGPADAQAPGAVAAQPVAAPSDTAPPTGAAQPAAGEPVAAETAQPVAVEAAAQPVAVEPVAAEAVEPAEPVAPVAEQAAPQAPEAVAAQPGAGPAAAVPAAEPAEAVVEPVPAPVEAAQAAEAVAEPAPAEPAQAPAEAGRPAEALAEPVPAEALAAEPVQAPAEAAAQPTEPPAPQVPAAATPESVAVTEAVESVEPSAPVAEQAAPQAPAAATPESVAVTEAAQAVQAPEPVAEPAEAVAAEPAAVQAVQVPEPAAVQAPQPVAEVPGEAQPAEQPAAAIAPDPHQVQGPQTVAPVAGPAEVEAQPQPVPPQPQSAAQDPAGQAAHAADPARAGDPAAAAIPAEAPAPVAAGDPQTPVAAAVPAAPAPADPRTVQAAELQTAEPQAAVPEDVPAPAPQPDAVPEHPEPPLGQFVPVDGQVPSAPHLAPTPPAPLVVPAQGAPAPQATVPAPREAEAVPQEGPETGAADPAPAPRSTGPAAPGYDDAEREAVLKVMRERRDIRNGFRDDPIPHEVLLRVLEAAHTAPSVGHSQPWDFVVIRSAETRRTMHELAMRQREAYAKSLPKGRAKQFKELKIEAILDTPVNIVVTADPTRGGRHTLGRHTQPQMAPYSAALAVENLWLAARAEGLGVGWVSFFDEREMVRALGLPEHLEVIAYLCVGYVDEFPDEPELMQAGWSKRRPLSWVVHEETYGRRALPGEEPHDLLAETVAQIRPLDAKALGEAWERQKRMTKPAGALGMLEIISAQLSGLSRQCPPPIPEPAAVAIFAGDHGVHAQGVTPWPQEVTGQMVANFLGGGAVCNAFAAQVGAEVCVVDVGVAADLPATPGLLPRKIRGGTSDMTAGPAMTREEAKAAIEVGIETARDLVAAGNKGLLTGEMGIANTTASAALISVFTGADPAEVTGRGTGINDETLVRKTEVVRRALELHQPDPADPIGVLAAVGGFEHAAMVGLLLGGASLRTPVILDGVSAGAAALVARAIAPEVLAACIAGHRSAEPGHVAALNKLGLRPLVDLDLRLGEGTGALLALPLVQSAARAMHEVATFDSAGVTEK